MQIKALITQKELESGIPCEPQMCPIALALRQSFPNASISVNSLIVFVHFKERLLVAAMPKRAKKFVRDFDNDYTRDQLHAGLSFRFQFREEGRLH